MFIRLVKTQKCDNTLCLWGCGETGIAVGKVNNSSGSVWDSLSKLQLFCPRRGSLPPGMNPTGENASAGTVIYDKVTYFSVCHSRTLVTNVSQKGNSYPGIHLFSGMLCSCEIGLQSSLCTDRELSQWCILSEKSGDAKQWVLNDAICVKWRKKSRVHICIGLYVCKAISGK